MAAPMRTRRAFTLIELLVVISILALLLGIGATQYPKFLATGKEADTRSRLQQLSGLLEQYRNRTGDYPYSQLARYGLKAKNDVDEGNEALVVGFFHKDYDGERIPEKYLKNQDGEDVADKNVTIHGMPVLLEVVDAWDNPFVYIRYDDYGKESCYEFLDADTAEWVAKVVTGAVSELTGGFYAKESYQLLSVGEDGVYGTADDIASYLE
ncbi:MAG: prepilin-type N-terminal cleavage/methylation domain-containing protein [Planctomycetes bacterium]|nr:prepilin-type N-terminal cleavage/methylation domain-containing protein [Planctomycetota bacterium]